MKLTKLKALKESLKISDLKILCTGELEVDYRNLIELQLLEDGRSLKQTDDDKILKLAESLLRFGIVNNLQVWFDQDENCFCFDAHHRQKALTILSEIGLNIPPLPATRCLAETKNDAKKLLLIKESRTSWVNVEVIPDYIKEIGFSFEVAEAVIDLPEFSWGDVEREADNKDNSKDDKITELPEQIFIKTGDLIEPGQSLMNIKTFKLSELQKAEYNPRTIAPQALKGLQKSIEKFGYLQPIIVNIHGGKQTIVGGHQRLKAMQAQGVKEAKCVVVDFDQITEKAANIALNSETISGDWYLEGLEAILEEFKVDLLEFEELNFEELDIQFDAEGLTDAPEDEPEEGEPSSGIKLCECPKCGFKWEK